MALVVLRFQMRVFCFFVLCLYCDQSHFIALFLNVECSRLYFLSLVVVFNVSITVFLLQPMNLVTSQVPM